MNRKLLIAIGIVALVSLGAVATDANAGCIPVKGFATVFTSTGNQVYLVFPTDADLTIGGPNLKGRFWVDGARGSANEGTACPEVTYLVAGANPGELAVYGSLGGDVLGTGACDNVGCPSGSLILNIQTRSTDGTKSYFAMGQISEDTFGFDFSRVPGNWIVGELPRPKVTTSGRAGSIVNLNLHFDPPALFAHGDATAENVITAYQVLRVVGNADPGRNPAAWGAPIQTVPTTSTGADIALAVDCSALSTDVFIATRAVFDGGQFSSDDVSSSTRVECDPTLADPRFKNIDKRKGKGPKAPEAQ